MLLRGIAAAKREGSRMPPFRPSFAACVNIKAYYFSISISDRTRYFLIYARGRTAAAAAAAAAKSKLRVVSLRRRARRRTEERRRRGGRIRSSRVTNEADTHLCPAFTFSFFLFPSSRLLLSFLSSKVLLHLVLPFLCLSLYFAVKWDTCVSVSVFIL